MNPVVGGCLTCPLPQCKYDDPIWYQAWRRRQKDDEIVARVRELGQTPRAEVTVSVEIGVTERTVFRILARDRRRQT